MIVSKITSVTRTEIEALVDLQQALRTDSRSAESRRVSADLRQRAEDTGECSYCHARPQQGWSPRHSEACVACGKMIDSTLMLKSKLLNGSYTLDTLDKLARFYEYMDDVPYALRGTNGVDRIRQCIERLRVAHNECKAVRRELAIKQARERLELSRKDKLRAEYRAFLPDATAEEIEEIVEAQYVQRYYQDI